MKKALPSERLQPLQQMAENREEDAARRLQNQQRQLEERRQRLQELRAYLAEYESQGEAASASMLLNRHAFIQRLREAVRVQEQLVEQANSGCALERNRWLAERREVSTLDQLADCYRRRENTVEERKAQKQMDDFALRAFVAAQAAEADGESK